MSETSCKLAASPETETWLTNLTSILPSSFPPHQKSPLRILDLCTGTGCISLLFHALLSPHYANLKITGIDISPQATALANQNLQHNIHKGLLASRAGAEICFRRGDAFDDKLFDSLDGESREWGWDVVAANPPYVSPESFKRDTERSVRNFEPRRALVPAPLQHEGVKHGGDVFYGRILRLAERLGARILAMEVADMAQAERVAGMMQTGRWAEKGERTETKGWAKKEIWRDDLPPLVGCDQDSKDASDSMGTGEVIVKGQGNGRCVVGWRHG
ncbi:MAG: hypothetical protein Q9174_004195 [Haloplaca sp. 1 TL-2023]